ncbi:MAG: hypothetical protein ABI574_05405 [Burkholderiales bacterium]
MLCTAAAVACTCLPARAQNPGTTSPVHPAAPAQRLLLQLAPAAAAAPPEALRARLDGLLRPAAAGPYGQGQGYGQGTQLESARVLALRPMAPALYLVTLHCPTAAACDQALSTLAAQREWILSVEPDRRAQYPTPPLPGSPAAR